MGATLTLDDTRLILPCFQIPGYQSLSMVTVHGVQLSPAKSFLQLFTSLQKGLLAASSLVKLILGQTTAFHNGL